MSEVYRSISIQFCRWNEGVRFFKEDGGRGWWLKAEQGNTIIVSIFFEGADAADMDAAIAALNKMLASGRQKNGI